MSVPGRQSRKSRCRLTLVLPGVAVQIPCRRHTSSTFAPASFSLMTGMICSSLTGCASWDILLRPFKGGKSQPAMARISGKGPLSDSYKAFSGEIRDGGATVVAPVVTYSRLRQCRDGHGRDRADALRSQRVDRRGGGASAPKSRGWSSDAEHGRPPASVRVCVDPIAIHTAVGNLLANAIRFTPQGGGVAVTLSQPDDRCVEVRIEDSGIGIPEDQIARCFEPFEQIDRSETRAVDGAGLALTVARTFIERHDGSLTLRSAVGVGTIAFIRLPLELGVEASELEKTRAAFKSAS